MLIKLVKHFSALVLSVLSCTVILQSQCAHALTDVKKLLRDAYMARLEYPSYTYASDKLKALINLLEKYHSVAWDKNSNWVLNLNIEMVFDDCPDLHGGKLCSPTPPCNRVTRWYPHIVANFGKSLSGNVWQLCKSGGDIVLERIRPSEPQ